MATVLPNSCPDTQDKFFHELAPSENDIFSMFFEDNTCEPTQPVSSPTQSVPISPNSSPPPSINNDIPLVGTVPEFSDVFDQNNILSAGISSAYPLIKQEHMSNGLDNLPAILPSPPSPEAPVSPANTSDVGTKRKFNEISSSPKSENDGAEPLALSRDELLRMSSKGLDEYTQQITAKRSLTMVEERQLKRQRRLIKNRESAQLSRMRKKMYIEDLERRVTALGGRNEHLTSQISHLAAENKALKEEVVYLRTVMANKPPPMAMMPPQNMRMNKRPIPRNVKAAGVCLMIVLFSFGLFFNGGTAATGPQLPSFRKREAIPQVIPKGSVYAGRVLNSLKDVMSITELEQELSHNIRPTASVQEPSVSKRIKVEPMDPTDDVRPATIDLPSQLAVRNVTDCSSTEAQPQQNLSAIETLVTRIKSE